MYTSHRFSTGAMSRALITATVAVACLGVTTPARAQERVKIGAPPAPGQSQRVRITQTAHMTMTAPGTPPPGFPAGGLQVETSKTIVARHDVGLPDGDGRVRYDVTYESMAQHMQMQGKEVPVPAMPAGDLTGKTFTVWLDAANQIAEVGVPEDLPLTADQAKQLLAPGFAAVPRREMAIGDVATQPLSLSVPMPGPGGGVGATMSGSTRITLVAIEGTGTDRVATLGTVFEGNMGLGGAGLKTSIAGTGSMQVHLLSGFVIASHSDHTIDGTMQMPGAPDGAAGLTMHGTVGVTIERLTQ
ncbi:MAG: hypothetical protein IT181_17590 [Acidobacteria bacterium]|nr:hypothetical protein [Acidobacteriota bacterium]